jgi:beta-glucosidase
MEKCAAVVQSFFPGEEGAGAIAGVLSGRVNPSARLPVTMPRSAGTMPYTYLHPKLGAGAEVTNLDPAPAAVFGHGLSYTTFAYSDVEAAPEVATDGVITASVTVTNTGAVAGGHIVQLYAHDVFASITRPVAQLVGFKRIALEPGQSAKVEFAVPTTRLAFSDRTYTRIVEPGDVALWFGTSATKEAEAKVVLTGAAHPITNASPRITTATISM